MDPNPDPDQNETDPKHWNKNEHKNIFYFVKVFGSCNSQFLIFLISIFFYLYVSISILMGSDLSKAFDFNLNLNNFPGMYKVAYFISL